MDPDQINELSGSSDLPLAMRMMEHFPTISASLGFANMRGSNTILRGGFMDDRRSFTVKGKKFGGPGKLGGFERGSLTPTNPTAKAYYGGRGYKTRSGRAMFGTGLGDPVISSPRRATRLGQAAGTSNGKMVLGKGARVNHITARPRALTRYNSLTAFNASNTTPFYSPFQFMANVAGKQAIKNKAFREAVYGAGKTVADVGDEQIFQRGMASMITAGRKADLLEGKAKFSATGKAENRAARKVLKAQEQVKRLSVMNNPLSVVRGATTPSAVQAARQNARFAGQHMLPASERLAMARSAGLGSASFSSISYKGFGASGVESAVARGQAAGLTGNLMASAGASPASRYTMGYFRGALGHARSGGLTGEALKAADNAVAQMNTAIFKGIGSPSAHLGGEALEKGVFKTLGNLEGGALKNVFKVARTAEGAKVLGARTAAMAIPGLNILATASLMYDLGKMGGEVIKSGINLAKDAAKSMKGSIDKPMFGMGYKDNEIAATSRARGVMAIQNSRLNARSMLGSEGSMMAAHFG